MKSIFSALQDIIKKILLLAQFNPATAHMWATIILIGLIVITGFILIGGMVTGIRSCGDRARQEKAGKKLGEKHELESKKLEARFKAENDLATTQKAEREANWERDNQKIKDANIATKQAEAALNKIKQGNYQETTVEELEKKAQEFENENSN